MKHSLLEKLGATARRDSFNAKSKTTINGLLVLFALLLMNTQVSWGQTPYVMSGGDYSEEFTNIANPTNWPNGFIGTDSAEWKSVAVNATGTNGDGVKTSVSSATFSTSSSSGVQRGTTNIQMLSSSTNNSCAIDLLLNFTGRNAGTISFDVATVFNSTGNRNSILKLFYSTNGTTFTEITGINLPYTASNNVAGSANITTIALPSAFNNLSTAVLRFYEYSTTAASGSATGSQPKISIDNISVTSTSSGSASPTLSADATNNTVDNAIDITFTDDSAWRTAVTAVKIGTTTLTSGTDYDLTAGNLQLKPSGLNGLLNTSGSKSVTVVATGYVNATVTQVINAGAPTANSTATISVALAPNTSRTITCTAKDQYNNLVSGYTFAYDVTLTNNNSTTAESYTINSSPFTATSTSGNYLSTTTNASGVATFTAALPATIDPSDGISVQVQLNDDATNVGSAFTFAQLASQTITFGSLSTVTYGDTTFGLTATASSTLPVSYTSSNTAVATVTGSTVTIVGAGSTNITVSQAGNGSYNAAEDVIQLLTVNAKELTLPDAAATSRAYNTLLTTNITGTLTGVINSDDVTLVGTLKGTFADANVANGIAVTSACTLSGTKAGNYTLTQPTGLTANITQASQTITFGALANKVVGDASFTLSGIASSSLIATYASSNTAVATVSGNTVTIVGAGSTDITASQAGNGNYAAATDVVRSLTVTAFPIVAWQFGSPEAFGTEVTYNATTNDGNLNTVVLSRGAGISATALGRAFGSNSWDSSGTKTTAINTNEYYEFVVNVKSGYKLNLTSLDATIRRTSTAPNAYIWKYSTDGSTFTEIGTDISYNSTTEGVSQPQIDLSAILALQNVENITTLTFRLYAWGGTSSTATFSIGRYATGVTTNSLAILGTIEAATSTTWTGSAWTSGAPTSSLDAIISGNLATSTDLICDDLTINSGMSLEIGAGNKLTVSGNLINNGTLIFKSNATNTAMFDVFNGSQSGNGLATVERYIPAKRAWRALTAPVSTTTSIFANWQEDGVNSGAGNGVNGLEIWSQSGGNGLAAGGSSNSLLNYNAEDDIWSGIPATNGTGSMMYFDKNKPFMAFVTGPYGSGNITSNSAETTLRATGSLFTGNQTYTSAAGKYNFIGNPYASTINPVTMLADTDNSAFGGNIWVWDANAPGSNQVGTYNLFNSGTYTNLTSNPVVTSGTQIQSGQAFFVKSTNGGTFTIKEIHKGTTFSNAVFRTAAPELLRVGLYKQINTEWSGRDGAMTVILPDADANQTPNKMANGTENVAFTKNDLLFASEHHLPLVASDVLNVKVWNTTAGANYKLKINTEQFNTTNLNATLEDVFTNSRTSIALDGTAVEYPFAVTTEATSTGNRFRIVFENSALGINNPKASGISILPNPITGDAFQVNLGTLRTGTYSYSISNALGQEVENGSINNVTQNTSYTVKFKNNTAAGMYIMKVTGSDNSVFTAKIIKQ